MHEAAQLVRKVELMRLLLAGCRLRECAREMDVSYSTIRAWAAKDEFLEELKGLSGSIWDRVNDELKKRVIDVNERIVEESEQALNTLIALMKDEHQKGEVRRKSANDILDRNPDTAKNTHVSGNISHQHKVDPMFLIHAAATASEVDEYKKANNVKTIEGQTGPDKESAHG